MYFLKSIKNFLKVVLCHPELVSGSQEYAIFLSNPPHLEHGYLPAGKFL
ncbi:MAG: hypothetical protein QG669_50, partial [Patescibacteria group bacterium]|nr:hypothetical protein [Patescibacteria group bacterium]